MRIPMPQLILRPEMSFDEQMAAVAEKLGEMDRDIDLAIEYSRTTAQAVCARAELARLDAQYEERKRRRAVDVDRERDTDPALPSPREDYERPNGEGSGLE